MNGADAWVDWMERKIQEKLAREREEDDKRFPPPLVRCFDLSDVQPDVLDGTEYEWPPNAEVAMLSPDGIVHRLTTPTDSVTDCNIWWARSERDGWRRVFRPIDCIDCLALQDT